MLNQAVAEAHEGADTRVLLGAGHQVLAQEGALDPVGEGIEPGHDAEGGQTIVETLDEARDVGSLVHKPEGGAKADLGDDVVGHVDGPRRKVKLVAGGSKLLLQLGDPVLDVLVDQRLHLLDVGEAVRGRGDLAVSGVDGRWLHVEQRLVLAEAARDVVFRFVCVAAVNHGKLGGVADEEHGGRNTDDGS